MHEKLISEIVPELSIKLSGRFLGRIFQLSPLSIAIDFGLKGEFLLLSVDPASPRLFLTHRRLKELEKSSTSAWVNSQYHLAVAGGCATIVAGSVYE